MWHWQFKSLAERAGMGDTKAMLRLGESFRGALPAAYLRLEAEWEENPGQKEDELADYLENHGEDAFHARAGIMWYLRAAAYGSVPAEEIAAGHPGWGSLSLLPEKFFIPGQDFRVSIRGSELRKAGLLSMKAEQEYSIRSLDEDGIFYAETYHGYEGPDTDGFGMEELYDFYAFDEFFNCLGCLKGYSNLDYRNNEERFLREIRTAGESYRRQREEYWRSTRAGSDSERCRWLLAGHKGVTIRNGVLVSFREDGTAYTIPEQVSAIGANAFSGNDTLEEILVPAQVGSIAGFAFSSCKSLRKLILPDHLTALGSGLCMDCRRLEEIHLPEMLEEIPARMFQFGSALKRIRLPEGLKRIGDEAFSYSGLQEITLPDGAALGRKAFAGSELRTIRIPGNAKLGEAAFWFCQELEEAVLEEGITGLPGKIFANCSRLQSVRLPASLRVIGSCALDNGSLKRVEIPEQVQEIAYGAFSRNTVLYGKAGTAAERYAAENGLRFVNSASAGRG